MKQKFIHKSSSFISLVSGLLFFLAFLPFLYPLVIPFSSLSMIFSALMMRIFSQQMSDDLKSIYRKSLRKSFHALLINSGLFLALFLHSWFCYTRTLNHEIEPFRDMIMKNTL